METLASICHIFARDNNHPKGLVRAHTGRMWSVSGERYNTPQDDPYHGYLLFMVEPRDVSASDHAELVDLGVELIRDEDGDPTYGWSDGIG